MGADEPRWGYATKTYLRYGRWPRMMCEDRRATAKIAQRKLTPQQVARARAGESLAVIAREAGVSKVCVFWAAHRLTYKDLP